MTRGQTPPNEQTPGDYEVGYKKPPRQTRFRKGRSGNPKGRPKGTMNLKTDLAEVLGERITVREGGRAQSVSKQHAFVISVVNRTLKGDTKSASLLVSMIFRLLDPGDGPDDGTLPLSGDELEVLGAYTDRVRQACEHEDEPETKEAA